MHMSIFLMLADHRLSLLHGTVINAEQREKFTEWQVSPKYQRFFTPCSIFN